MFHKAEILGLAKKSAARLEVETSNEQELLFEWKCLLLDERFPHGQKIRIIDSEHMNRYAANLCPAAQRRSCPLEVFAPQVHAWMEESNDLPRVWICPRDVRTFVPIAVKTREGEILKNGLASMLTCNDVIHVKGQRIDVNGKVTIFTSVLRGPRRNSWVSLYS